ncbi:MAG: DoxX family membrane protein [Phycisphaerales bacterium]|nr:DoxX family membrane protein [Phycisphaerales bacterium]
MPALVLRLVLAAVFLWAGIGKFASTALVTGDDAARLKNLGVLVTTPPPADSTITPPALTNLPDPSDEAEEPAPSVEPVDVPVDDEPILETPEDQQRLQQIIDDANQRIKEANKKLPDSEELEELTTPILNPSTPPPTAEPDAEQQALLGSSTVSFITVQQATPSATASDFPHQVSVRRFHTVTLLLDKCTNPGLTAESQPIDPILPSWMSGTTARYLAMLLAVVEILAGTLLLIGFMTRLSALGTLGVMLMALWTTQFGPAAMQSGDAFLGFIPNHGDIWDISTYSTMLLQLSLAAMSIAVFFLGSGPIGMDRMIFGASKRDKYLHGDPKAGKAPIERDAFDRSPNPTP